MKTPFVPEEYWQLVTICNIFWTFPYDHLFCRGGAVLPVKSKDCFTEHSSWEGGRWNKEIKKENCYEKRTCKTNHWIYLSFEIFLYMLSKFRFVILKKKKHKTLGLRMAESLCCSPETTTTLLIGSTPIQNKVVCLFVCLKEPLVNLQIFQWWL